MMAGGYTGQMLAMDVNTPSETQLATAQADTAQTQSQLARQSLPAEVQLRQAQAALTQEQASAGGLANQSNALTLQQQIQDRAFRQHYLQKQLAANAQSTGSTASPAQSPLASTAGADSSPAPAAASQLASAPPLFDPQVQKVMQSIDPNDPDASQKWDDAMTGLMDEVPQAQQFIGQYSPGNLNNWRGMIGAHTMRSTLQMAAAPAQAASPDGAPSAMGAVSPVTGKFDPDIAAMFANDPKAAGEFVSMQGQMMYQQTGDINYLKRFAPDVYKAVATADKDMTETQKTALTTRIATMGQAANAVLALAHQYGNDAPEVKAAYKEGIIMAAKQGWMAPQEAQKMINAPVDFGRLAYLATESQTVSDYMKTSGQQAANEAAAVHHLERVESVDPTTGAKTVRFVPMDANGNVIGPTAAPGVMPTALPDIVGRIATIEGTGQNPNSSANGIGQFTDQTWLGTMKRNGAALGHPDLASAIVQQNGQWTVADPALKAKILGMKADPAVATQMLTALVSNNAGTLQSAGIAPTADNIYLANFLGSAGAVKALRAAPATPIAQVVKPDQIAANPTTLGRFATVGDLRQWAAGKMAAGASDSGASGPGTAFVESPGIGASLIPAGVTGAAALAALPPAMQPRVQQLLDGRSILTAREKATPQGQALLQAANQIDPLYDESSAPARVKAMAQFTGNGKAAQVAASGNRLAYHLNDLYKASQALVGPDTGFGPLNSTLAAGGQMFQPAAVARYEATLPFIAGELQKLTKNGSATEGETKLIMANLSPRQSAETRLAAIQQVASLAEGQFKPFRDQYQSVFGSNRNPPVDFTPTTSKIFERVQTGAPPLMVSPAGIEMPPAAVAHLRANPALRAAFDAKYGASAAAIALSGQ